ncbi:hypothetical protein ACFL0M_01925 [Thermodesulfobacteriota bacterium]
MKENGLGNLFLKHLVIAIPWSIIFLVVFFITAVGFKQQVKEGIQYAIRTSIHESSALAFDAQLVIPVKKNIKEGIEFVATAARKEVRALLQDPQVKQDLKEALEFGGQKFR